MLNAAMVFVWKMFIAVARCQHKSVKNVSRALTTIKPLWNLLLLSRDSVCLTACEPQSPCEQERKGKKNFFVFFDCDFYHQDAFTTYLIDRRRRENILCDAVVQFNYNLRQVFSQGKSMRKSFRWNKVHFEYFGIHGKRKNQLKISRSLRGSWNIEEKSKHSGALVPLLLTAIIIGPLGIYS